ncbi:MAG: methyltransferase domain-containing protein [Coriobacteriaceae bacterium]|nr:methyltransferase domain-containing protein [Coriobacteriaceae bacterium]
MHARSPKNFVLEERLERYADAIEVAPEGYRGIWAQACAPAGAAPFISVHLDLGCGKGTYLVKAARRDPRTLYIGVDSEPVCIAYAAQAVCEGGVRNALVIPGRADDLARLFAPGELAAITLSFPTPHPRKKQAPLRVTQVERLLEYRAILMPGGTLTLRTDSRPFLDFSITQLEGSGWRTLWTSEDVRADHPEMPESEYERKLTAEGARVLGIAATPGPEPTTEQIAAARSVPQSLFEYLPDDLYEGSYIPHGMSWAVETFRNRRANAERRADQEQGAGGNA